VIRCKNAITPSELNTVETITTTNTDNKPVKFDLNINIGIVKTDEATSPSLVSQSQSANNSDEQE